jgi:hypothetical protein
VTEETHRRIRSLATAQATDMQDVVDLAVRAYERRCFWDEVAAARDRLAANPNEAADAAEEDRLFDRLAGDGIER